MTRIIVYVLLSIVLFISFWYHYHHPGYNWDMLPYMGIVLEYEGDSTVHEQVYTIAKTELPPAVFTQLTDSSVPYRSAVYRSPELFRKQLPFYVVKPLYTRMAQVFYHAGLPLTKATVVPSLIACFLLMLVMLSWMQKYLPTEMAVFSTVAISVWGPVLQLSKTSGPDALSALLLVSAAYCILEKKKSGLMYFLLLLSVLTRIDNVLPALFFIAVYSYHSRFKWKERLKLGTWLVTGCIICYFFVASLAVEYEWSYFYYSDFFLHLRPDYNVTAGFSFRNYFLLLKSQLMTGLYYSQLPLFLFLSICIMTYRVNREKDSMFLAAIWVILAIRYVLHPVMTDRLFTGYYLIILMILLKKLLRRSNPSPDAQIPHQRKPT